MKIQMLIERLFVLAMLGSILSQARAEDPARERRPPPSVPFGSKTRIDPSRVITDLQSLRGEHNEYLRVDGKIPRVCRDKIGLSMKCRERDQVLFTIKERSQDGFQCLKDYQNKCKKGASGSDCVSIEDLSKDAQVGVNFQSRIDSNSTENSCKHLIIASAKVAILKHYFDPHARTEADGCKQCEAKQKSEQHDQFAQLQNQISDLKAVVDRQQEQLTHRPQEQENESLGGRNRMNFRKRAEKDDTDTDDEDVPRRSRRGIEIGDSSGIGSRAVGGMGSTGMTGGMGGTSMMSPMMGYGGMNMMGMSSMYRSPYMTSYSPYMSMYPGIYSSLINPGYSSMGYMGLGTSSYYNRSLGMLNGSPYSSLYGNYGYSGLSYSPYYNYNSLGTYSR